MAMLGGYILHGGDTDRLTTLLKQFVAQVQNARALGQLLSGVMAQANNGGTAYGNIEVLFSLEPGKGQAVNDVTISAANALITHADIQALLERLG